MQFSKTIGNILIGNVYIAPLHVTFHLNWLDFEIVMTIFGTAKKGCSNTFDQYCLYMNPTLRCIGVSTVY